MSAFAETSCSIRNYEPGVNQMVAKCANPVCNGRFTYFGTGELLVRTSPVTGHQELFWLCQQCAGEWQVPDDMLPLEPERSSAGKRKRAAA